MSEMTPRSAQGLAVDACQDPGQPPGGRRSLQRRVQNALRWRSWGGESDTAGLNHPSSGPAARPPSKPRGRSVGSDVELSSISSGTTSTVLDAPSISGALGYPSIDSMHGAADGKSICSYKSSASSAAGGPLNDTSSTVQRSESQAGSIAASANDDLCSVATQAGSAVHSFTSLHSMMADQGDAGSDAGYAAAGAAIGAGSAAAGTMSPTGASSLVSSFRGSDAGADGATSVSTLPLISEAAYDDEQLLEDSEEVRSLGDVVGEVTAASGPFEEQDAGIAYADNPLQASLKPRVSSHGSMTSFTSETSSSLPGGPAAVRIPSPGMGSFGRSLYSSSQRSGSGRHSYQQQQGLALQGLGLASLQQQQQDGHESRSSMDLPLPFSTRKRPDNDEACSFATQAGSVHSVSSVMSSAFMENNAPSQRQLYSSGGGTSTDGTAAAGQEQQQHFIHPLSEPAADASEAGGAAEGSEDDDEAGFGSSVAQHGTACNSSGSSSPVSSHSQQQGVAAEAAVTAAGHQQHQQQSGLERKGSLKGALRSMVAWGSGLGQRLHRAGSSSHQHQHSSKHQHGAQHGSKGSKGSAVGSSGGDKGQQQAGTGSGSSSQELANF